MDPAKARPEYRPTGRAAEVLEKATPLTAGEQATECDAFKIEGLSRAGPFVKNREEISAEAAVVCVADDGGDSASVGERLFTLDMSPTPIGSTHEAIIESPVDAGAGPL